MVFPSTASPSTCFTVHLLPPYSCVAILQIGSLLLDHEQIGSWFSTTSPSICSIVYLLHRLPASSLQLRHYAPDREFFTSPLADRLVVTPATSPPKLRPDRASIPTSEGLYDPGTSLRVEIGVGCPLLIHRSVAVDPEDPRGHPYFHRSGLGIPFCRESTS